MGRNSLLGPPCQPLSSPAHAHSPDDPPPSTASPLPQYNGEALAVLRPGCCCLSSPKAIPPHLWAAHTPRHSNIPSSCMAAQTVWVWSPPPVLCGGHCNHPDLTLSPYPAYPGQKGNRPSNRGGWWVVDPPATLLYFRVHHFLTPNFFPAPGGSV